MLKLLENNENDNRFCYEIICACQLVLLILAYNFSTCSWLKNASRNLYP